LEEFRVRGKRGEGLKEGGKVEEWGVCLVKGLTVPLGFSKTFAPEFRGRL